MHRTWRRRILQVLLREALRTQGLWICWRILRFIYGHRQPPSANPQVMNHSLIHKIHLWEIFIYSDVYPSSYTAIFFLIHVSFFMLYNVFIMVDRNQKIKKKNVPALPLCCISILLFNFFWRVFQTNVFWDGFCLKLDQMASSQSRKCQSEDWLTDQMFVSWLGRSMYVNWTSKKFLKCWSFFLQCYCQKIF